MAILVVAPYMWARNMKGIIADTVVDIQPATLGLCEYQKSNECGPIYLSKTIYCNIRVSGASNCVLFIFLLLWRGIMIKEIHKKSFNWWLVNSFKKWVSDHGSKQEAWQWNSNWDTTSDTQGGDGERKTEPPAWAFETLKPTPSDTPSPKDYTS